MKKQKGSLYINNKFFGEVIIEQWWNLEFEDKTIPTCWKYKLKPMEFEITLTDKQRTMILRMLYPHRFEWFVYRFKEFFKKIYNEIKKWIKR